MPRSRSKMARAVIARIAKNNKIPLAVAAKIYDSQPDAMKRALCAREEITQNNERKRAINAR